ncbi:MAG: hypothetical protein BJ554DRAFT_7423, partial [Olpidium bornovanus]
MSPPQRAGSPRSPLSRVRARPATDHTVEAATATPLTRGTVGGDAADAGWSKVADDDVLPRVDSQSPAPCPVYYHRHVGQEMTGALVQVSVRNRTRGIKIAGEPPIYQSSPTACPPIAMAPAPLMPMVAMGVGAPGRSAQAPGRVRKERKKYAPNACTNCRALHLSCDVVRPCPRCVASGKGDSCVTVYKKRGRPTKSSQADAAGGVVRGGRPAAVDAGGPGAGVDQQQSASAGVSEQRPLAFFGIPAPAASNTDRPGSKRSAAGPQQQQQQRRHAAASPGVQFPWDPAAAAPGMPAQVVCNPAGTAYPVMPGVEPSVPALYPPHVRTAYAGHVQPIYFPAGAGYVPPSTYPSPLFPAGIPAVVPPAAQASLSSSRASKKARLGKLSSEVSGGSVGGGFPPESAVMSPVQHRVDNGWSLPSPTFTYTAGPVNHVASAAPYPYCTHPQPEYYAMNTFHVLHHSGQPQAAALPGAQYLQLVQTPSPAIPSGQPALLPRTPQSAPVSNLANVRPVSAPPAEASVLALKTS